MDMSSHPDSERVRDGELSGSYDEALALPPSHTEGLAYAEDPTLANAAYDIYTNEVLFGAGLQQEWDDIVGPDPPERAFLNAYEAYVTDPTALYREAPDQYHFLKEHVFYGHEYHRAMTFGEQVGEGIAALESMELLRPEVWEGLSVGERAEALQEVEAQLAKRAGRPAVALEVEQMAPHRNGYFDPETGTMHLNQDFVLDNRALTEAVDTIAHEGRHAYQHYAVEHPGFHPDAAEVQAWAENFQPGNYLTAELYGYEAYKNQPVEADAWAFGDAIRDGLYGGRQP